MESMLPPETKKASLGRPKHLKASAVFQSGWDKTATQNPNDSNTLPITLMPKEGWST
jgi:hypothetical protein